MKEAKILVVDDEPAILLPVSLRLESAGYEVLKAADGQTAYDLACAEKPDLIVLDVLLPKMDGYKVCRMLKFDEHYKSIPIILFTARAEERDMAMGFNCGADAYMVKPFQPQQLLDRIEELLLPLSPE